MWETKEGSARFKLFCSDRWIEINTDSTIDSRLYVRSCKKDLLLFNLDYFAMMVKDKCMSGTQLEKESYKKIATATEKLAKKRLTTCCKNIIRGKSFFRTVCLIDKSFVDYAKQIIDFCELNQKEDEAD